MRPRLDEFGHEIPDPKPVAIPAGFKRPETLAEQVQRLVRTSISRQAAEQGFETFEESEDFDVDDEFDPSTPYETFFDPVLGRDISPQEFKANEQAYRAQYLKAQAEYYARVDQEHILAENLARSAARKGQEPPQAPKSGGDGGTPPSPSSSS